MSFWNKIFSSKVKYTENTNLQPLQMGDIDPFEVREPSEETLDIVIPVGGTFTYSYFVHGSVGYWWDSVYDKDAFEMCSTSGYLDPERCKNMCGADAAVRTQSFKALRKGDFKVIINHQFRGKIYYIVTINVQVR